MTSLADADLSELVDEWLDWTEVGRRLGVTPAKVRTMVKIHELAAAVPEPGRPPSVPAAFLDGSLVVKGLPGLLTVLHDGGYDDRECIAWLFLDAELPGSSGSMRLRENRDGGGQLVDLHHRAHLGRGDPQPARDLGPVEPLVDQLREVGICQRRHGPTLSRPGGGTARRGPRNREAQADVRRMAGPGDFPDRCRRVDVEQDTRAHAGGATLADPATGLLLDGRYLIGPRIARGGMAAVYEALDTRLDRECAVKIMHPGLGDDGAFAERFKREARAAARLSHPNVVSVFDQGEDPAVEGALYLVMELVPGHTLRDVIRDEAPMQPARAVALMNPSSQRSPPLTEPASSTETSSPTS